MTEAELAEIRNRYIGFVFQQFNLLPSMTALRNVMEAPVQVLGRGRKQARDEALTLLDRVGLGDRAVTSVHSPAGGRDLALHELEHLRDRLVVCLENQCLGADVGDAPQRRQ